MTVRKSWGGRSGRRRLGKDTWVELFLIKRKFYRISGIVKAFREAHRWRQRERIVDREEPRAALSSAIV